MPERNEADQMHDALAELRADSEKAWQQRRCLTTARFWKVALGLACYEPAEKRHVLTCPHCRRRDREVNEAAHHPAGTPEVIHNVLAAAQELRAGVTRAGKTDPFPGPQRLTFPEDAHLTAEVKRDRNGEAWLQVRHAKWKPHTLIRVVAVPAAAGGKPWSAFALLRPGDGTATARLRFDQPLFKGAPSRTFTVQALTPAALTVEDVPALRAAFASARKDDPGPAAWHDWASDALDQPRLPAAVCALLDEVRRATLPPERGGVQ